MYQTQRNPHPLPSAPGARGTITIPNGLTVAVFLKPFLKSPSETTAQFLDYAPWGPLSPAALLRSSLGARWVLEPRNQCVFPAAALHEGSENESGGSCFWREVSSGLIVPRLPEANIRQEYTGFQVPGHNTRPTSTPTEEGKDKPHLHADMQSHM